MAGGIFTVRSTDCVFAGPGRLLGSREAATPIRQEAAGR